MNAHQERTENSENNEILDFDAAYFGLVDTASSVIISPYATSSNQNMGGAMSSGDEDMKLLHELKPEWIVMYDPDVGFVRRVEVDFGIFQCMFFFYLRYRYFRSIKLV